MKLVALCLGFLVGALPAYAQSQRLNPAAIVQALASNRKTPRVEELVNQLGLTRSPPVSACTEFTDVAQKVLWSNNSDSILVIEAYSDLCVRKFLIVLDGPPSQRKYAGTISLDERDTAPTYTTIPLFIGQRPGIMVTGNVVDSGTGILQENRQIFAFLGGSLRLVFNQPERARLAIPFIGKCCPTQQYVRTQTSTFHITKPTQRNPTAMIEETRRISVNGRSLTEYLAYAWSKRWKTFYSTSYAPAD